MSQSSSGAGSFALSRWLPRESRTITSKLGGSPPSPPRRAASDETIVPGRCRSDKTLSVTEPSLVTPPQIASSGAQRAIAASISRSVNRGLSGRIRRPIWATAKYAMYASAMLGMTRATGSSESPRASRNADANEADSATSWEYINRRAGVQTATLSG